MGAAALGAAVVLALLAGLAVLSGWWWWLAAGVLGLFGAVGIFEGRKGWCAVRAMGFRTPV